MKTYFENKKEMKTFADLEKWGVHLRQIYSLGKETETLRAEGPSGRVETGLHRSSARGLVHSNGWTATPLGVPSESSSALFLSTTLTNPGLIFL